MSRRDMDLSGIIGLPRATSTPNTNGVETHNPYARDKRVALNREVYETLVSELKQCADALSEKGYKVSVAEMLQAVLHFGTPANVEEAEAMWQQWGLVKSAPPLPVEESP
jgi:hypothetical protein